MKRKFITGFICGAVAFGTVGVFAGQFIATENTFPIQLNGENVSMDGYNIDGNTYFKLRDISDIVGGFDVGFNNSTIQLSTINTTPTPTVEPTTVPVPTAAAALSPAPAIIFTFSESPSSAATSGFRLPTTS